jgi:hypothetical protein
MRLLQISISHLLCYYDVEDKSMILLVLAFLANLIVSYLVGAHQVILHSK